MLWEVKGEGKDAKEERQEDVKQKADEEPTKEIWYQVQKAEEVRCQLAVKGQPGNIPGDIPGKIIEIAESKHGPVDPEIGRRAM
ncbi:MAG: hypothetical protein ACYTFW_21800 [Planctomycetota bacterium]|jgi:hypothetical protein